jgi:flagellar motility protein MotE (MotC chaperone)
VFAEDLAHSLDQLIANLDTELQNLENLERRLTTLEEKMVASARVTQTEEDLYAIREALDRELRPYRSKMSADQIAMLERRYLDTALLERMSLPRLSLFYLR